MTIDEYQEACLRTEPMDAKITDITRLENGLMGLNGEAGEAIDVMKKFLFQGHELDKKHLAKELGDVAWYLAVTADALGYYLEDIFQMNIDKLKARYPDGFDPELSKHRKDGDI
jgi:NTP pyrophosphatase (non-canonical NTP hydrolase)